MQKKWNKKILVVVMRWDYGDKSRGLSGDVSCFYNNFAALTEQTEPFWYDAYFNDLPGLQRALLEKAEVFNPDLIFFLPYTDQFHPETLDKLKAKWPTCAWFGDDTWRFENYSSKMAPHYSYAATTDPFSVDKYRKIGVVPILTQWAAQPSAGASVLYVPGAYEYGVSFVGGYNKFRAWFVSRLNTLGIDVKCFGYGWPAGKVSFEEMETIFRKSRINLNLSNSINRDIRFVLSGWRNLAAYLHSPKRAEQIKARNFEIPLAGGFQLTNYVPGLERYLRIGEEVAVYSSPEECALQISHYLSHKDERTRIARAGHQRAMGEHTYFHRLSRLLGDIWGPADAGSYGETGESR